MRNLIMVLIVLAALALSGCATNPVNGKQDFVMMSEQQEIELGRKSDVEVRKQYEVYASATPRLLRSLMYNAKQ
jgi:predicted Zn-dependent protease